MKLEWRENNKFIKNRPGDTGGRGGGGSGRKAAPDDGGGGGGGGSGGGGVGWNLAAAFSLGRSRLSFFSISL